MENSQPTASASSGLLQSIRNISLRTRLVIFITAITLLTAIVLGTFYYRISQQTQGFLNNRLENAITKQAEQIVLSAVLAQTTQINAALEGITQNINAEAEYLVSLFSNQTTFGQGTYWNAQIRLSQPQETYWTNAETELAEVYIPQNVGVNFLIYSELNTTRYLDFFAPKILQSNPIIIATYFISRNGTTVYYPNIDLGAAVGADFSPLEQNFYQIATPENNPSRAPQWTVPYQDPAQTGLIITHSIPIYDGVSEFRGVLGIDGQLGKIAQSLEEIQVGETGYSFMIDSAGRIIFMSPKGYQDFEIQAETIPVGAEIKQTILGHGSPDVQPVIQSMLLGESGVKLVDIHGTQHYAAYAPIKATNYSLGIIVPSNELSLDFINTKAELEKQARANLTWLAAIFIAVTGVATLLSLWIGRVMTTPLIDLTQTAKKIATGDLSASAKYTSDDEIGTLASTFNDMTAQLNDLFSNLEVRVAERTTELEQRSRELADRTVQLELANIRTQRRAAQLQAISDVTKAIATVRKLEDLLPRITKVVSERFNYYHVGVFLTDEARQFAILSAANSEGGKRMLARGHRLEVGVQSIVGYVIATGTARIALDTGTDAIYFNNPDLPNTRSEMAIPLQTGRHIIGVLDLQSTQANAFSQEDLEAISTLADQITIAIQNSRSFESTQKSITEAETLYRQFLRQEWKAASPDEVTGFRYSISGAAPLETGLQDEILRQAVSSGEIMKITGEDARVALPIKLRDEVIGVLNVHLPGKSIWKNDEISVIQAVANRVAISAENARLFEESQIRAAKERTIGKIADRIGSSTNLENVFHALMEEIGQVLPGSEIIVQFKEQ